MEQRTRKGEKEKKSKFSSNSKYTTTNSGNAMRD
jgi:hypothetical protein